VARDLEGVGRDLDPVGRTVAAGHCFSAVPSDLLEARPFEVARWRVSW
jgi:hypothetical protein